MNGAVCYLSYFRHHVFFRQDGMTVWKHVPAAYVELISTPRTAEPGPKSKTEDSPNPVTRPPAPPAEEEGEAAATEERGEAAAATTEGKPSQGALLSMFIDEQMVKDGGEAAHVAQAKAGEQNDTALDEEQPADGTEVGKRDKGEAEAEPLANDEAAGHAPHIFICSCQPPWYRGISTSNLMNQRIVLSPYLA